MMSGILYYFPGRQACGPETPAEFGLEDIFRDASAEPGRVDGPRRRGRIFA